ncbi:efflux RND transporter periplasmic adaptor subunit [Yoonia sp. MH D7]
MRFLQRSLTGLFLMSATLALFGVAFSMVNSAIRAQMADEPRQRPATEQVLTVNAITFEATTLTPELSVFGEVQARRTLDIRPSATGRVIEISDSFQSGGVVEKGEILLRLDPNDAQSALDRVRADVRDAEAETRDAQRSLALGQDEFDAATEQARLREAALARQVDLRERGVGTTAAVENAELAVSAANQAVLSKRQSIAQSEARLDMATTREQRMQINLSEARRTLADTTVIADFAGILADTSVVEGGRVTANQLVAQLIDLSELEVAFRVSTAQHARLLDAEGRLISAPATVRLDVLGGDLTTTATISREGASVAGGQVGRLIFARMDSSPAFRPGDFVTLTVAEPTLEQVALLPSMALGADNTVLVIGDDNRLTVAVVVVLRRQGDAVIVRAPALHGASIVAERSPILGAGIKVNPLRGADDGVVISEAEAMVVLTPDRRAKLIAFVQSNSRMADDAKARILTQLEADEVSVETVERLETRMGG